jgi:hypothetical protein
MLATKWMSKKAQRVTLRNGAVAIIAAHGQKENTSLLVGIFILYM